MYLVSKESIGNCRSSSDFNENLMKIYFKKIRKSKFQNSEKNKKVQMCKCAGNGEKVQPSRISIDSIV